MTPEIHSIHTLYEGQTASLSFLVTDKMMKLFRELSGDKNPIHIDPSFARSKGFEDTLVYGGILVAQLSKMIGMYLPGLNGLWSSLSINFSNPLMIGESVELIATITHVSTATLSVKLAFEFASKDSIIANGSISAIVMESL